MSLFYIWKRIEVVITGLTRKFSKKCQFCPPKIQCFCGLPQFEKPNILQFFPSVLSKSFGNDFRIDIRRVVRVVEGAALEILRGAVRFVHQKPCSHAGFTRFEKLNNLLFFPSVLSKALFYRKKAGKNGG